MFQRAEDPESFRGLWAPEREDAVRTWLEEALSSLSPEERKASLAAFKAARKLVHARLKRVKAAYLALGIPTFLTDAAHYGHVRSLWLAGRVFALRGDLLGRQTLRAIGAASRAAGLSVGALYLSNAEQYFDYLPDFRDNLLALPFDETGVVLHTISWKGFGFADGDYHYSPQPGRAFQRWLSQTRVASLPDMLFHRTRSKVEGFSTLGDPPERLLRAPGAASEPAAPGVTAP
jgi:hypothetical protein